MVESLFLRLAQHAAVLDGVLSLARKRGILRHANAREVNRSIGFASARLPEVTAALKAAQEAGVLAKEDGGSWQILLSSEDVRELALLFRGAHLYNNRIQADKNIVQVVISKPKAPSRLLVALERTLEGTWGLSNTADVLGEMAARAKSRLTIMSPFVDDDGANRILELFSATGPAVLRELIVRDGLPAALERRADELRRAGVKVFDFRLPREASLETETFHAKVVRVDEVECYVGSSNMNRWSFSYSLELGFHVKGIAGEQISRVVDAVLSVSPEIFVA